MRLMDFIEISSKGTAVANDEGLRGLSTLASVALELLDNVHSLNDFSEDDMLSVEPLGHNSGDEELGAVGVGSGIGHREQSGSTVLDLEVLVFELLTIDGFSSSAVFVGEVTSLNHELRDDSVEGAALVSEALFSSAESSEVGSSQRNDLIVEKEGDFTQRYLLLGLDDGNVKENFLISVL